MYSNIMLVRDSILGGNPGLGRCQFPNVGPYPVCRHWARTGHPDLADFQGVFWVATNEPPLIRVTLHSTSLALGYPDIKLLAQYRPVTKPAKIADWDIVGHQRLIEWTESS